MTSIEVRISKEVRDYQESLFFDLSQRQFLFALLAVLVAAGLYFGLRNVVSSGEIGWACVLAAFPFALCFSDINYAIASKEDKTSIFLGCSELLNALDSGSATKLTINNKRLNRQDFEQKILLPRQNSNSNFSAVVPYDLEQQRKETMEMLDDLTTLDQRMMFAAVTLVHLADSKDALDSDTDAPQAAVRKHLCQLSALNWQQANGLVTALPLGLRRADALRTLTTKALAVRDQGGVYYGQSVISKNLIIANRKELLNGSGFVLGVSGFGKSFTAKREMVNLALSTEGSLNTFEHFRQPALLHHQRGFRQGPHQVRQRHFALYGYFSQEPALSLDDNQAELDKCRINFISCYLYARDTTPCGRPPSLWPA